ncbi:MAG: ATP-binding protein [Dehalococcoidales bacterium]|nr:ATP-binding protein [Dehalococcoidales bacterium]
MNNDAEIILMAYERENSDRIRLPELMRKTFTCNIVGATPADMQRLLSSGHIEIYSSRHTSGVNRYRLTDKGRSVAKDMQQEKAFEPVSAESVMRAFDMIVGFDDIKIAIAKAIEVRKKLNFLLEGPPACAKSLILEGIRAVVPEAYMAFGSRTSASGLSDELFTNRPSILLLDELDKMRYDCYSVLLGIMESGELIETKSQKTRGGRLETVVIAACNSSDKMPREFISRFAMHICFPLYTRNEFIDVCHGYLTRAEKCPPDIAKEIGRLVFYYNIGDVRKARSVWQMMQLNGSDAMSVVQFMLRYSKETKRVKESPLQKKLNV